MSAGRIVLAAIAATALGISSLAFAGGGSSIHYANGIIDGTGEADLLDDTDDVAISRDGEHVYVTGAGDDDGVSVFRRNQRNQKLSFVQDLADDTDGVNGLATAEDVAVSPDGRFVYVTGYGDDALAVFKRNPRSGRLRFDTAKLNLQGDNDRMDGPVGVSVSPDNDFVYVTAQDDDANSITWFERTRRGKHKFAGNLRNGQRGVENMVDPWGMDLTRDGKRLYVAANSDDAEPEPGTGAVIAFERNARTGKLRFLQSIAETDGAESRLGYAFVPDVSPDDRHLYVAATDDDAIVAFKIKRSGRLREIQARVDGGSGGNLLADPYDVAVTPDGRSVYSAGYTDDGVVAFNRNPRTGKLTLDQEIADGEGDADELAGVWRLAADNKGVFLAAYDEPGVAGFERRR
jgi:6-phosphogluconolactonase (cycloisomerase 2 family)